MSKPYATQLIGAAKVMENFKLVAIATKPQTESQTRPLTKLPAYQQPKAWAKAVEAADGKVSLAIELNQIIEPVPI